MGWGVDVRWSMMPGLEKGVVDATPVRHLGSVAADYAREYEDAQVLAARQAAEERELRGLYRQRGRRWAPWQEKPHWVELPSMRNDGEPQ